MGAIGGIASNIMGSLIPKGNTGGVSGNAAEGFAKTTNAQAEAQGLAGLKDGSAMMDKSEAFSKASNAMQLKTAIMTMMREMIKSIIQSFPKG